VAAPDAGYTPPYFNPHGLTPGALQGDDYPLEYDENGYPELSACLPAALGGNAQVVMLPDKGLHGNTHFAFSDLNNEQVADLLSAFLKQNNLDRR
jgi:hypothetical protein